MPKISKSFSIEKEILLTFTDYCDKNSINMSDLVEKHIIRFLKERGAMK